MLSQINLIENGGFEKYSNLNCNNVAIHDYAVFPSKHVLDNWETLNSSDYFTAVCTS
ncbi:MAG: hypothetical protein JNM51_08500, partial [Bacteroidia bacterium]|nr:hypothetical protein [Bacteroidia bacterium]